MNGTLMFALAFVPTSAADEIPWRPMGLELRSDRVAESARFYEEGLGFTPRSSYPGRGGVVLELDEFVLVLRPASPDEARPPESGAVSGPYLNLVVGDLEQAMDRVVEAGGVPCSEAGEPRAMVLGRSVRLADPGGNPFHLIELAQGGISADAGARLFNVGLRVADVEAQEPLMAELGFDVLTRSYLPYTLPFERSGVPPSLSSMVLHPHADALPESTSRLLLEVPELEQAMAAWAELGLEPVAAPSPSGPAGRTVGYQLPGGLPFGLVERSPARLAFERLRGMVGSWVGESTKGWVARVEIEVIAAGSVVTLSSEFEAHPDDRMLTCFHMDGGDLILTHYCVAQNQPRLIARAFPDGGIDFDYLDATGIPDRDHGHMDRSRLRWVGDDAFRSRWTWFQDGQESWMEEIEYRRADGGD